jgi:outer membrane protein OmpA-like peptidoglycan-associated protein
MGKKYYITESQMKRIVSHVKNDDGQEVIEEGMMNWVVSGLLTLATIGGVQAQNQTITPQSIAAAEKVQEKMNDGDLDITKYFTDAEIELNQENLTKIKSVDSGDMDKFKTSNPGTAKHKLKQGFAIKSITITKDTVWKQPAVVTVDVQDTLDFTFDSGDMFKTGSFELNPEILNDINQKIKTAQDNGTILSVLIESSTDTEPIEMGNDTLAQKRANSVKSVLSSLGVDAEIKTVPLPEQGPDAYSTTMSDAERDSTREQTADWRYVDITFVMELSVDTTIKPNTPVIAQVKEGVKIEMIKIKKDYKPSKRQDKRKSGKKIKQLKCKKTKSNGKEIPCYFQSHLGH